ncbi:MAG: DNA polymerase IV [Erysipelotrichaceae bacterium]
MKMWNKAILHSDINHCYAQIEEMKFPQLRNVPMAVGGHEESRHGIILTKNDMAKQYHLKTGESLRNAYEKCPNLVVIPPNYDDYMYYTEKVKDIYRDYSDYVESFGLDEAWIDISASQALFGEPEVIAHIIQQRVLDELGLTVSIGVSYNKIFAKLGSDMIKPSGLVVISEANYKDKVWPLPVEDLFYVGHASKEKLLRRGITTIGELANQSSDYLKTFLGKNGEMLWYFANGLDISEVALSSFEREVKSVGNSITTPKDIKNLIDAQIVFYVLAESVASRLKDNGLKGSVISIGLRNTNLEWISRQQKIEVATNISKEIMEVVMNLVKLHYDFKIPLRSIGISVSRLVKDGDITQLNLFVDEFKRNEEKQMDKTMDEIRNKYGFNSIKRCVVLLDEELTDFDPKGEHIIHPVSYL